MSSLITCAQEVTKSCNKILTKFQSLESTKEDLQQTFDNLQDALNIYKESLTEIDAAKVFIKISKNFIQQVSIQLEKDDKKKFHKVLHKFVVDLSKLYEVAQESTQSELTEDLLEVEQEFQVAVKELEKVELRRKRRSSKRKSKIVVKEFEPLKSPSLVMAAQRFLEQSGLTLEGNLELEEMVTEGTLPKLELDSTNNLQELHQTLEASIQQVLNNLYNTTDLKIACKKFNRDLLTLLRVCTKSNCNSKEDFATYLTIAIKNVCKASNEFLKAIKNRMEEEENAMSLDTDQRFLQNLVGSLKEELAKLIVLVL